MRTCFSVLVRCAAFTVQGFLALNAAAQDPAGDAWLGAEIQKRREESKEKAVPIDSGLSIAMNPYASGANQVTPLRTNGHLVVRRVVVSSDCKTAYFSDTSGSLYKIALPSLICEKEFVTKGGGGTPFLTKNGLALHDYKLSEILVFDPESLVLKSRTQIPEVARSAGSPGCGFLYLPHGQIHELLGVFDVEKGKIARTIDTKDLPRASSKTSAKDVAIPRSIDWPAVSPDGKYLIFVRNGFVHRFKLNGDNVVYEEASPHLLAGDGPVYFSPDSKSFAVAARLVEGSAKCPVFKTTDLQKPATILDCDRGAVAFDTASKAIFVVSAGIRRFSADGKCQVLAEGSWGPISPYFLVMPGAKTALLQGETGLHWIEFP
jgi:hypothetical protein